jgi:hypothetical protein
VFSHASGLTNAFGKERKLELASVTHRLSPPPGSPCPRAQNDLLRTRLGRLISQVHSSLPSASNHDFPSFELGAALIVGRVVDLRLRSAWHHVGWLENVLDARYGGYRRDDMQTTADGDVRGMNGRCFCRHSSAQCPVHVWPRIYISPLQRGAGWPGGRLFWATMGDLSLPGSHSSELTGLRTYVTVWPPEGSFVM